MDSVNVATHYDNVQQETKRGRKNSTVYRLRQFNNWVKAALIDLHTRPGYSVLDLCCGKGGDMSKWYVCAKTLPVSSYTANDSYCRENARISKYVGCDIAEVSVRQAMDRYNREKSTCTFRPMFLVGDMFKITISDYLRESQMFDVVSCQFAMHYAFESEVRVRQFLLNVTERLRPGGFFIGTTPDANVLVEKLYSFPDGKFGNGVYQIQFENPLEARNFHQNKPFGIRYFFTLGDKVVNCPEFLVHFPTLERLASEYGLQLLLNCNFHDFFTEFSSSVYPKCRELLSKRRVFDRNRAFPTDQWEAIHLYTAFAFRKAGEPKREFIQLTYHRY